MHLISLWIRLKVQVKYDENSCPNLNQWHKLVIANSHANKDRNSYNNLKAVHFEVETAAMNFDKDFRKCVWHRTLNGVGW